MYSWGRIRQTADPALFSSSAGSAGVFLDFDGTLSEIVARPHLAQPAPGAIAVLLSLVRVYRLVTVVSGRPTDEVARLLGVKGVRYEGCYGLESRASTQAVLSEVAAAASAVAGAWAEPKGASVAVHYREARDPVSAGEALARGLRRVAGWHGLELIEGKKVLELVPAGASRKGGVVERLAAETGLTAAVYAGDDAPDLEAFTALDRLAAAGTTTMKIAVRGDETPGDFLAAADVVVDGPTGLIAFLRRLA